MTPARTDNWNMPTIEHNKLTPWNWMVSHPENLQLGRGVDIGAFTYIQAAEGVIIEDGVQIGSHCAIYSINTINDTRGKIHIARGATIGTHSVILPRFDGGTLRIGEEADIGAFSLVYDNVLPREVIRNRGVTK